MKIFGTIAVVLLLSVGMFGQGLPLGNCPPGSTSCPTAQLPINHAPSAVPSALRSLAATATFADSCNPGAHIWCVGISGTGSNAQANEALLFTAWQNAGAAIAAGSTGEVVVVTAGFQYNGQTATLHGPFNMPNGGCIGNGLPPNSDPACSIIVPTYVQPNPSSPAYVYTVSTHYNHAPAVGVRIAPYNGNGYSVPAGQVANVCTGAGIPNAACTGSDFAKINASSANWGILFPDHLNGMAFEMVEFGSVSTIGEGFPLTELGYSAGLVYAAGAGAAGARAIVINNAGVKDWLHSAIIVDVGLPLIVKAYTTTGSCTGSGPDVVLPSGVATIVCFVGANTNWVNGQSFIRVTWQGRDWPAQDITVNSTNCGSGFSTSPNLCVVDHTHAFVSITGTATSPTNGGMHDYYIDTPPTGFTGSSAAGTEHSVTNEALIVTEGNPAPTWTMTCATCPAGGPTGGFAVPADGVARVVTANGTPAGGGQTNWTSDHVLSFGGTAVTAAGFSTTTTGPVSPGTNVNIPVVSSTNFGASVTATIDTGSNLETFTITSVSTGIIVGTLTKSHASGVTVSIPQWVDVAGQVLHATVTATSSGSIPVAPRSITIRGTLRAPLVTPVQELDVHYKGLSMLSSATHGIDYCTMYGSRQISNFVERSGGPYTLTCFGIGTTWATLPSCSSSCGTSEVNFGSDITINSITPVSNTQLQVTFTLASNTEEGSKNLIFEHVWAHGVDGNILNSSTNAPCTTTGQDCYQTGAQGLIAGIRGDAAGFSFIDGYLDSVHAANVAQDTPGFYASLGTGPILLQNSFFEAATENVFTGGAGSMDINSATEPCDVEITGNYLYKPPYWHNGGISVISTNACVSGSGCGCVTTTGHYKCVMSVKDNEEHKSGCRIHSWNNVMDGDWTGVNVSYWTVSVTPRDAVGQGTISSGTLDLNIGPNIIVNILNGINATSYDVNCVYGVDDNCVHGVMATTVNHRNVFQQDLFIANQNENSFGNNGHPPRMWNVGTMLQNFLLFHNTFLLASDISESATNGTYYNLAPAEPSPCGTIDQPSANLWALNNVWYNGFGGDSGCTPMAQSGQAGWASSPLSSPNAFVNRFIGNAFGSPTTGIWTPYPTNGVVAPTVVTSVTSTNAIVGNAFNGNYELNGTLPGLANWITPPTSPQTTDGTTAGIDNPTVTAFVTAAITGGGSATLTVSTTSLPNGTQAVLYSGVTAAVGGTTPYTWCIIENSTCDNGTGGALPPGLSLSTVSNQGQITGTPTTGGVYPFTVKVTDALSNTATAPLSINVLGITTLSLPSGFVLVPYSTLLGAAGGTPPYGWSIISGTICSGLGLSSGGAITGIPTAVGTCTFTVRATDSGTPSRFVNALESITISNVPAMAPTGLTGDAGLIGGKIQ